MDRVTTLRFTDPDLDFWVDVRVSRLGEAWLATADLAGTPELGVSDYRDVAVLFALWSLGPDLAQRLAGRLRAAPTDGLEVRPDSER
jgi:hypothetical protein